MGNFDKLQKEHGRGKADVVLGYFTAVKNLGKILAGIGQDSDACCFIYFLLIRLKKTRMF